MSAKDDGRNKRKRDSTGESSKGTSCSNCGLTFSSRNQLFRHLRSFATCSSGHLSNKETPESKRKVILIVAYIGKAYHGSARNDNCDSVPTVEGCLWKSIADTIETETKTQSASSLALQRQQRTNPNGMTRSSRTDKGVSSLGNIFTLFLPGSLLESSSKSESLLVSAINDHLPNDIRLLRFMKSHTIPHSFDARLHCESRRYRYLVPVQVLLQKHNNKESILDLRKRLKRVLMQWGGTHSFHNFTNWKPETRTNTKEVCDKEEDDDGQEASSCFRHILRCHVEDVIQHDQLDFVVISIKGQSFLYHQIRKMMGATIGVMNQSLPVDLITEAFKESEIAVQVPLAPAEGLVLVEALYSKYCSKNEVEPIGLGTKLLYRHKEKDCNSIQNPDWETANVKLLKDTKEFQQRVYLQICKEQAAAFFISSPLRTE